MYYEFWSRKVDQNGSRCPADTSRDHSTSYSCFKCKVNWFFPYISINYLWIGTYRSTAPPRRLESRRTEHQAQESSHCHGRLSGDILNVDDRSEEAYGTEESIYTNLGCFLIISVSKNTSFLFSLQKAGGKVNFFSMFFLFETHCQKKKSLVTK